MFFYSLNDMKNNSHNINSCILLISSGYFNLFIQAVDTQHWPSTQASHLKGHKKIIRKIQYPPAIMMWCHDITPRGIIWPTSPPLTLHIFHAPFHWPQWDKPAALISAASCQDAGMLCSDLQCRLQFKGVQIRSDGATETWLLFQKFYAL